VIEIAVDHEENERVLFITIPSTGGFLLPLDYIGLLSKLEVVDFEGYSKSKYRYSKLDLGVQIIKRSVILPLEKEEPKDD
jgi:hypothetical protein